MLLSLAIIVVIIIVIAAVAAGARARTGGAERNEMSLKKAYLYLVSVISLVIWVVGSIILVNMALKTWVFTKADQNYYYDPCISAKATSTDRSVVECTPEEEARQKQQQEDARTAQKQRDAAQALSMIIIAAPVWWFHWRLARREV